MKITGHTILITGGATGIGLALAEAFLREGSQVIICGRREKKLQQAKLKLPSLHIMVCDISKDSARENLFKWATNTFPNLNILVNNAGIQKEVDLRKGAVDLLEEEMEIDINLKAPIHLSTMFIPHLIKQRESAIVNITSGLAFTPLAVVPIYCATKAGLHSFSQSLRHQLRNTSIKVFEVAPPIVDTELDRGARENREQENLVISPVEVAEAALKGIKEDQLEIVIGLADNLRSAPEKMFNIINR
ncbi:short-chain dehydrogenase/reductase SDR [Scytonema sp. HK-05]|uniref:SDR family oxidoreductase n=1 Tax=Scytonema sp. HK-05 TaxID=1137095 RepID=UPI0009366B40|nr:SDR family NAD(P)-dependent oxidoreductase [Scytonema sp. HK-05]OKH60186.1 short-chain dehydrogenase [Scytonema sp. HK-05]BAY42844.1 short-chain dehydrogenase/reductase SDR [Scytonema sp. HK-05]